MNPVRHVFRKELTLHLWPAGRPSRQTLMQWIPALSMVVVFVFAFSTMGDLEESPVRFSIFIPLMLLLIGSLIPSNLATDSFAGERERHTLETVLAGPVTPRLLLWGKILAQLALLGGGLAIGTVLSLLILLTLNPTPTEYALFFLAFPFVLIGSVTLGLMMLLLGNLASVQSPNVKATMPRILVYMTSGFAIGYLPSAVLVPLILGYSQQSFEPPSPAVILLVFALQILAVLGYFGYLGYMFVRLMKLTREETFKMDV